MHLFVLSYFITVPLPIPTSLALIRPATPTPPDTLTAPVAVLVEVVVLVNEVAPVTVPPDNGDRNEYVLMLQTDFYSQLEAHNRSTRLAKYNLNIQVLP